jgi:hypothetical protein
MIVHPTIVLGNKGINSITYGDTFNYVHSSYSGVPVLRLQKVGDTSKVYEALSAPVISTTSQPNDTLTMKSANAALILVWSVFEDGYDLTGVIQNNYPINAIDYDLKLYTHRFRNSIPTWDGTTKWLSNQQGWDINAALEIVFNDPGQSHNPWQCWSSSLGPFTCKFNPKNYTSTTPGWEIYLHADTDQPGIYCVRPIASGDSVKFNVQIKFSANKPDPTIVAPKAFSIQSNRWPMQVHQDRYPTRMGLGANWFCTCPPSGQSNAACNPNGWNNDRTLKLYDTDGKLCASKGDYTGIKQLWDFIKGRMLWCNYVTHKAGGLGVIHWDFWYGQKYTQPGLSYIGDSTISRSKCPELWYSDANWTSISSMFLTWMKYAYNGSSPPTFLGDHWLVGAGLRASIWTNAPPKQRTYPDLTIGVKNLIDKIYPLYWAGHRVFYLDSFGPYSTPPQAYAVDLVRKVMVQYPDILLIPEAYSRVDMYSASYPFRDMTPTRSNYSGAGTSAQAPLIWPRAASMVRWQNKGDVQMNPSDVNYPATVEKFKVAYNPGGVAGDCVLANCYSGSPTEFEQAMDIYHKIEIGEL